MSRKQSKIKGVSIDWIAVGRRIRTLRGFDLTQADFANKIGVTQSYLSAIERGRGEIGAGVLLAIGNECNKSLEWLLTGKED
jgi:XRE family transcriptional regulator, fatty acid utilization regulator